jgi:hypothetical protein
VNIRWLAVACELVLRGDRCVFRAMIPHLRDRFDEAVQTAESEEE